MGKDAVMDVIDGMFVAAQGVRNAMDRIDELLAGARQQRLAGKTPLEVGLGLIERGSPEARASAASSFDDFERAVMAFRQLTVRSAVEDDGWSVSELARRMGISRQRVSRLYQAAKKT